ncbi:PhnD/SsuA/transferrin family substrate-binding protein [Roseibacterium sp. SDUM158017]|uniref:PhnD/SsuA/transferrin family substrate-binding protein n=1 Tax=Roseicyclus salinarum TaxID=3036773 RepID=UPI0024154B28|nr:PhnD/SsuA/transferrin family substrate-binding protein [Roseibacterium sp. SDUM158017]MDG4649117.1 PhnD/SsuA/transferrin family substrate-binding protein [Roseibacterium sp. SDUM158017]
MIATLPMYLRPETRDATDGFWALIRDSLRDRGVDAPDGLDHAMSPTQAWARSDLVLSQICNLPHRLGFSGMVTLVAAPDLGLPDAPPGTYYSVLVAHADDPRGTLADFAGATLAINGADSQSGWGAPAAAAAAAGIAFGRACATGAHSASARAVAARRADIAALDVASWRMIRRWDAFARDLRVIGRTPSTPALAYVTAAGTDPAPHRAALAEAFAATSPEMRGMLGLAGILDPDPAGYAALPVPAPPPA